MDMDYQAYFEGALRDLKEEGNYRVFADLERHRGTFPTLPGATESWLRT